MKNAAIGIVWDKDQLAVLLVQRRDVPVWVLPGGGIDAGETPEQTVVRELLEETGLQVKIRRKAAEYLPINYFTSLTHVFECDVIHGRPLTGTETRRIGFFSLTNLPTPFFCFHDEWLKEILINSHRLIRKPMSSQTFRSLLYSLARHPVIAFRYLCTRLGFPINSSGSS